MQRKKIYIILLIFLAFGLCLQLLTLPMIKKSQVKKLKLEERKAYLVERKKIIERIEQLQEEYKSWQSQIERLDLALPVEPELESILFQFQNFSADSGLVMKSFSSNESPETAFRGATSLLVTTDLMGNYTSLKAFLKKIEKNLRIINVKNISFSAETKEAEKGKETEQLFPINLSAKLYYFPQESISKN